MLATIMAQTSTKEHRHIPMDWSAAASSEFIYLVFLFPYSGLLYVISIVLAFKPSVAWHFISLFFTPLLFFILRHICLSLVHVLLVLLGLVFPSCRVIGYTRMCPLPFHWSFSFFFCLLIPAVSQVSFMIISLGSFLPSSSNYGYITIIYL